MLGRSMRLRALAAATGLVASMFVVLVAFPGAAQARCRAVNNLVNSNLVIDGATAVEEAPVIGTCNNNDFYQADFRSHQAGWRASVWIQNNGNWTGHYGAYNTNWHHYEYSDGNSHSAIHFCLDNGDTWKCGWGDDYTVTDGVTHNHFGINQGF